MSRIESLPLADGTSLAVRWDEPSPDAPRRDAAILYMHGFRSEQAGEKAEFFRARATEDGFLFCSFDFRGHGLSGGDHRLVDRKERMWSLMREFLVGRGVRGSIGEGYR